jgi:hypothetical protein
LHIALLIQHRSLQGLMPNGLLLSRLAGCAHIGSVYNTLQRRYHAPYLLAEGQGLPPRECAGSVCSLNLRDYEAGVGSNRGLGYRREYLFIYPSN